MTQTATAKATKTKKAPAKKPRQAKRGRPKGSPNKKIETVRTVPPGCRVCHSTELKKLEGSRVMVQDHHGTLPADGARYTSVTTRRMICKCGSITAVKTYDYDPAKWVEGKPLK